MTSISKSSSIRDIENKYGINMTTCSKAQLDSLTSNNSKYKSISKLNDLMLNTRQFDLDNMTDIEKANLKYLVMSTDELLNTLKRKVKSIYYKPQEAKLRWKMSYNDFYQVCAYKLLLNDGILRFNANYKLDPAIHCWILRTAMWQTYNKVKEVDEITILDKPCGDDASTTIGDLILKDDGDDVNDYSFDVNARINMILNSMDHTESNYLAFKAGSLVIPYSEYSFAKLFIVYQLGKKELSKMLYNTSNNKLVSNQTFNKLYKKVIVHISELLNSEANEYGESFIINTDEL